MDTPNAPPPKAPLPESTKWYTPKTLAQQLGVKPSAVYGAIKRGELRASCLNGRHYVVCSEWAADWIADGIVRAEKMRTTLQAARDALS